MTTVLHHEKTFSSNDLLVFSHLRWDFVFQRPQHLITRFAKKRRVFFIEEPQFDEENCQTKYLQSSRQDNLQVIVPILPRNLAPENHTEALTSILDQLIEDEDIQDMSCWYYTPMAWPFSRHLKPASIVFDCMDELSAFKNPPANLLQWESELLKHADVVFTGGISLYEAKRHRHPNIHPFPSSIDQEHFKSARRENEPEDQKSIPHPRLGFFGVIDERMDIELLRQIAELRPDWQFILIGPVVKIDPNTLPRLPNIHYLGQKDYRVLPKYLSGWDSAFMPFAKNESTRYISPTKTPEFLAAGRPVVSTSIHDVVHPYGDEKLVSIADTAEEFVKQAEVAMHEARTQPEWLLKVDEFLDGMSWDVTFGKMAALEKKSQQERKLRLTKTSIPSNWRTTATSSAELSL
jgi:UDP-galactopyranose mutase